MTNFCPGRRRGAANAFIEKRTASGFVSFSLQALIQETGLTVAAAKLQIRRLGVRVARVSPKQAFFVIVAPEYLAFGAPPATWWLNDYFSWLDHPYYVALQSAAAIYGAAPQAPQVIDVITDTPRRAVAVGRIRVRFFVKRGAGRTLTQPPSHAYAPLRVSSPEATAFDLVRYASRLGGLGQVKEILSGIFNQLRVLRMKRMLEIENEKTTAQRLGYLLEKLGQPKFAAVVHAWLPVTSPFIPLVAAPSTPARAPVIKRWRLLDNSHRTAS